MKSQLSHISISYETKIVNERVPRLIKTDGILHITKYNETYFNPPFSFREDLSDYMLISLAPDTTIFKCLTKEGHILLSKNQLNNLEHLKTFEVRFNFSDFGNELFENNYVKWSKDRILIKKTIKKVNVSEIRSIEDRIDKYGFKSDLLKIDPTIYLDLQQTSNGILMETTSVLDTYNSFNHLDDSLLLQAYVNIYFDLVEMHRRQFVNSINIEENSVREIENKFNELLLKIDEELSKLKSDSFGGTNIFKLKRWNDLITSELDIDNFQLLNITIE